MGNAFYFGCRNHEAGHYLQDASGRGVYEDSLPKDFPVKHHVLDAGLLPPYQAREKQVEGLAQLAHIGGWTILAFWDRSVDKRYGCNSAFVFRGTLTFEETKAKAAAMFPKIWGRFTFEVKLGTGV